MQNTHRLTYANLEVLYVYNFFHVSTTFYVPLLAIIICYLVIGLSLKYQFKERLALEEQRTGSSHKQQNTTHRFVIATACIVCTFVLTWLPYQVGSGMHAASFTSPLLLQVLALLRMVCEKNIECEDYLMKFYWLEAIMIACTCINPFLYKFGIFKSTPRRMTISGAVSGAGTTGGTAAYMSLGKNAYDSGGRMSVRSFAGVSTTFSNLSSLRMAKKESLRPDKSNGRGPLNPSVVVLREEMRRGSECPANGATLSRGHRPPMKLANLRKTTWDHETVTLAQSPLSTPMKSVPSDMPPKAEIEKEDDTASPEERARLLSMSYRI